MTARFAPAVLQVDTSKLSPGDRAALIKLIDAGRVVQIGVPEDIFHHPTSAFVAGFMGADNVIDLVRTATGALAAVGSDDGDG